MARKTREKITASPQPCPPASSPSPKCIAFLIACIHIARSFFFRPRTKQGSKRANEQTSKQGNKETNKQAHHANGKAK